MLKRRYISITVQLGLNEPIGVAIQRAVDQLDYGRFTLVSHSIYSEHHRPSETLINIIGVKYETH